ncbi:MAG: ABC transporter substrate-binding protein [Desulfomonilaceae bacterium]
MRTKGFFWTMGSITMISLFVLLVFSSAGFSADKTIKIGCITALTGFAAPGEGPMGVGSQLAADWINDNGGITIKSEKYRVKLITEDHKSTAEGAAGAANKLVYDDKVKFIIGGMMPFTNIAIGGVTEPARVLHAAIGNCSGIPDEYGPKTPYTFVTMNGALEGIRTMLDYIKETHPTTKKIAVTQPDDGSIPIMQPRIAQIAKEHGMTVSGNVIGFALDTVDFTPIAKKLLARKADAIVIVNGWPSMVGGVLKIARQSGFASLPVCNINYPQAGDIFKIAGSENSANVYFHSLLPNDPKNPPIVGEVLRRLKAKSGNDENLCYAAHGFDNLWMVVQAIEAAQSLDPTVVRDKWEKMDTMKSVWGTAHRGGLKTYGIKHTMTHPIPVVSYVNGEPKTMKWMDIIAP